MSEAAATTEPAPPDARVRPLSALPWLVFAAALGWNFWRISTPSLWRDEIVTATIVDAGPGGIYDVVHLMMDRIHVIYYGAIWVWTRGFGMSEISLRAPSAIAMAVAAAALFLLARRYTTITGALTAAAVFTILPSTTHYAHEARSYAFVVAGVVVATLLLHLAAETGDRKMWAGYAGALVFTVLFSFLALLILPAHAVFMWRRVPLRTAVAAWAPSVAVGGLIAAWSSRQSSQVSWIGEPTLGSLRIGLEELAGGERAALLFFSAGIALFVWMGVTRRWREWGWMFAAAASPALLWVLSHAEPLFVPRYILFAVPFYALVAGVVTARVLPPVGGLLFVCLVAYLTHPQLALVRGTAGHTDDFRAAQGLIAQHARSGDAVVFDTDVTRMGFEYYDDQGPARVADPLEGTPKLEFLPANAPCTAQALAGASRVWEVQLVESRVESCGTSLRLVSSESFGMVVVNQFE